MKKKVNIVLLLLGMVILMSACSNKTYKTSMPVIVHNTTDQRMFFGNRNILLLDIVKDTPENRKILTNELRKLLDDNYKNSTSRRKEMKTRMSYLEAVDFCQNALKKRQYSRKYSIGFGPIEDCYTLKSGSTVINYSGVTLKGQETKPSTKDIIFQYYFEIIDNEYRTFYVSIQVDNGNLVIYRTSNKPYPIPWLTKQVKLIIENNQIESLKLQYYNFSYI